MGVQGLCKFIDGNPQLTRPNELCDTKVIIDGSNLAHRLYGHINDNMLGGDYLVYAKHIKDYFSTFSECNIEPIIVLDGGTEQSGRKFQMRLDRQKDKVKKIKLFLEQYEISDRVSPIGCLVVFKNILSEIGLKVIQCDYEGDNHVAALANDYECPVLSEDSDFYIFNLRKGFIRFSDIDMRVHKINNRGEYTNHLKCKIFYYNTLFQYYPLKDKNILSLIATLAGNDHVHYEDVRHIYSKMKIRNKEKFIKLFDWFRYYSLQTAVQELLSLTEIIKRSDFKDLLDYSIEDYKLKPTNLNHILDAGVLEANNFIIKNTKMVTRCHEILPMQFIIAFHQGLISPFFLTVLTLHQIFLSPQVENFSCSSSHTCSRYVRQIIYGILLHHSTKNRGLHNMNCLKSVEEFDRVNNDIECVNVKILTQLKNEKRILSLSEIYEMPKSNVRGFLLNVLELRENFFLNVPSDLQLFLGCIIYWYRNSSPKPKQEFIDALLLCIVYHQKQTEINFLAGNAYLSPIAFNYVNPLDIGIVHSYSQLQCCVSDIANLNSLLDFPFESFKLHKLISCTMLYRLTKALISTPSIETFIKNFLGTNDINNNLFSILKYKIFENVI